MTMSSSAWQDVMEPTLNRKFIDNYKEYKSHIPDLFSIDKSTKKTESLLGTISVGDFQKFEGNIAGGSEPMEAYLQTVSHTAWANKIQIDRELKDDDQTGTIDKLVKGLARSARRTREKGAFRVFNHAFDTTFQSGGDGLALCSTAHTSPANASTQSNYGTSRLSRDSYNAARLAMRKFKDWNNDVYESIPDLLLVTEDDAEQAIILTESILKNANNDINAVNKVWKPKVIITPYLTETRNWFLIDSDLMKENNIWFNRIPLELFNDKSSTTLQMIYAGYYRCSTVFTDWRWCFGSNCA